MEASVDVGANAYLTPVLPQAGSYIMKSESYERANSKRYPCCTRTRVLSPHLKPVTVMYGAVQCHLCIVRALRRSAMRRESLARRRRTTD